MSEMSSFEAAWFGSQAQVQLEASTVLLAVVVACWSIGGRPSRGPLRRRWRIAAKENKGGKERLQVEEDADDDPTREDLSAVGRQAMWMRLVDGLSVRKMDGIVNTAARSGHVWIMEKFVTLINSCLVIPATAKMKEAMAVAYAYAGLVDEMEDITQALAERTRRTHAQKACVLQCLFATVFSASYLCLLGALGFMGGSDENEPPHGFLGWNCVQDVICLMRMMFGPLLVHFVAHAHPGALEMDQWQDLLLDTLLV